MLGLSDFIPIVHEIVQGWKSGVDNQLPLDTVASPNLPDSDTPKKYVETGESQKYTVRNVESISNKNVKVHVSVQDTVQGHAPNQVWLESVKREDLERKGFLAEIRADALRRGYGEVPANRASSSLSKIEQTHSSELLDIQKDSGNVVKLEDIQNRRWDD
jgi:hypothetical protein